MRATARVLGISRDTVSAYLRVGGPPGRQGAASSTRGFGRRLSLRERAVQEASSFDELRQVVQEVGGLIQGIGELAVCGTALRIGVKLDLPPTQVYLHRGSRDRAAEIGLAQAQLEAPWSRRLTSSARTICRKSA